MTARLEFGLGLVALVVAGLSLTALYLRAEIRREQAEDEDYRPIGLPSP